MLLASKTHTAGNTTRWILDYDDWLDNTATIASVDITSSSTTCTVQPAPTISGHQVIFFLTGGLLNEILTLTVTMQDSFGNIKKDTLAFTVVAP